jgi:hypothetical protein
VYIVAVNGLNFCTAIKGTDAAVVAGCMGSRSKRRLVDKEDDDDAGGMYAAGENFLNSDGMPGLSRGYVVGALGVIRSILDRADRPPVVPDPVNAVVLAVDVRGV